MHETCRDTLSIVPSGSPWFLLADCCFSRIFHKKVAAENLERPAGIRSHNYLGIFHFLFTVWTFFNGSPILLDVVLRVTKYLFAPFRGDLSINWAFYRKFFQCNVNIGSKIKTWKQQKTLKSFRIIILIKLCETIPLLAKLKLVPEWWFHNVTYLQYLGQCRNTCPVRSTLWYLYTIQPSLHSNHKVQS